MMFKTSSNEHIWNMTGGVSSFDRAVGSTSDGKRLGTAALDCIQACLGAAFPSSAPCFVSDLSSVCFLPLVFPYKGQQES